MDNKWIILVLGAMTQAWATGALAQSSTPTLKKISEFDLPGPGGKRFDYLTIDEGDNYLISAHLVAERRSKRM